MRGIEQVPWIYDSFMWLSELTGLGAWRRRLLSRARGRVLEVGCGTGRNLPLYRDGVQVIGFDPHLEVLGAARRRGPGIPLLVAGAEAIPFRDGAFDTVVSSLVFCSVPDPELGLREVERVLRPGGTLRMMEHVRHTRPLLARFQDWIQPAWTRATGGCHPNRDTEATVEASGFRIDAESRRANGTMRLFTARRDGDTPATTA